MKAADFIIQSLHEAGVTHVFELSGGMITFLLDAMNRQGKIKVVSVHHEQAAAFAADGYGRMTGVPGVAMATSGPGATNLLTGVGSCYFDSAPSLFITGQVNRHEQKGTKQIRQLGFQETDIVSMAKPITKLAVMATDGETLPALLRQSLTTATTGRPGPVLLDVPMDVQRLNIESPLPPAPVRRPLDRSAAAAFLDDFSAALSKAQRPLVLVGGGIAAARAVGLLRQFVRAAGLPVVNSLLAVDVMPATDPLRMGMIGSYGNRWANHALGRSDLVLVLGSRLDVRQTGADTDSFKADRQFFHVDVDEPELNNRVTGCRTLVADLHDFLAFAVTRPPAPVRCEPWLADVRGLRRQWPDTAELPEVPGINPNLAMHQLSAVSSSASAFVVDVGQHQMWAAQSLDLGPDQRFLTSGGMGSMGYALPAALGAACATPGRPVVVIAGDGGFQCNIQELQTIVRNKFPIKIVVVNNRCHGMVRQFQQSYFDARYQSTLLGYDAPDFAKVAAAYGMPGRRVERPDALVEAFDWLWKDPTSPALLEMMVDTYANAYPKMAFGKPITEMEPFSKPTEMEST